MRTMQRISKVLSLLLVACGGGGGGSEKSLSVAIDSPVEGARIIGSRSIVVTGTVGEGATVMVSTNGGPEVEASVSGGTFSATLTLDPRENAVAARATKAGETATASSNVFYPFLSLRTFQDASVVIGQPDFRTGDAPLTYFSGNPGWDR